MGITIRKAKISDLNGIIRVNVETWDTSYRGVVPDSYIQGFKIRSKDKRWQKLLENMIKENIFLIAENNKAEIVGFAIGGLERTTYSSYEGELMGIYILKEYQRQGIGKALTRKIVKKLIEMKVNSMLVWVLESNPYRVFYEDLGGKVVDKKEHETLKLPIVAYGYDNLKELMNILS
ncbi:MAG: GNAT family N-acetyltransferase [Promethearchaeota archaeon]|nr:MAG: GNAT family N-acetyltransferase [Candidatus Lokiarchaeota archaeon]